MWHDLYKNMFNLSELINPKLIISDLNAKTKEEAIRILIDKLFELKPKQSINKEETYQAVIKRENLQSTGIGEKIAIPHARIEGWKEFALVMGISKDGIDFQSPDKAAAKLICLMISPAENPYTILQTMAAIARFIKNINGVDILLRRAGTAESICEEFKKSEIETSSLILAHDIMQPVKYILKLDTPIEEVIQTMHLNYIDVLPVVNENNKFCGQLSCLDIFEYGIPNFFKQLHTVSFVRHIDPFEKYFKIKRQLKVKDLLKDKRTTISKNATLIEILFDLTVKNKPRLFVVDDNGILEGVIDRFNIVDRILFF